MVEKKNEHYYSYQCINKKEITSNTISIVMTAHERSKQVYFTLETINRCNFKDIHVIIVDDSSSDVLVEERLREYNIYIELLSIKQEHKFWANPCVNYNLGFQYIKGNKLIIQNGEVCYVGDVLEYVNKIVDDKYYVFDVKASASFITNDVFYNRSFLHTDIYKDPLFDSWYQHSVENNRNFHFLTSMTTNTFKKINGFSYDYSFGSWFDDDDFVLKIIHNAIHIVNCKCEIENIGGIHLYHDHLSNNKNSTNAYESEKNTVLFKKKTNYVSKTGTYIELSNIDDYETLIRVYNNLLIEY